MSDEHDDAPSDAIRPQRTDPIRSGAPRSNQPTPRRDEDDRYEEPPPKSGNGLKTVLVVLAVVAILGCCTFGGLGGAFVWFGMSRVRESAGRTYMQNNYKQIGLAMHNYASTNDTMPPMAMKTKDGKPGLSWRVAILPYIDEDQLYRQFKIDEAWDHPDNLRLASRMPRIYAPRRGEGGDKTHVRVFTGPGTLYDPQRNMGLPRRIFEIMDGTSNTFYCVEATDPVLWIQPDELKYDSRAPLPPPLPKLGLPENDYFIACMCDGWVRPVKKSTPEQTLRGFITPDGGEIVQLDD